MNKKLIILSISVFFICFKLWQTDIKDRNKPFGTDDAKNNKYAKNIFGEYNGVSTFWGNSSKKDNIKKSLDRIEWISSIYKDEIIWRRCLVFSLLFSLLIIFINGENINFFQIFLINTIVIYLCLYSLKNYEIAHIYKIKNNQIQKNIYSVKKKLNLDFGNTIHIIKK